MYEGRIVCGGLAGAGRFSRLGAVLEGDRMTGSYHDQQSPIDGLRN